MAPRDISEQQRKWLNGQLNDWQSLEILSADQATSILDLYETETELADRKRSIALLTLMGVAAVFIGLGALLLVGYNWASMPDAMKLIIIFGVLVGTQAIAFTLRFSQSQRLLSEVVFLLSCIVYGVGIFLVAQIFHFNVHYPDGVWWWALGVLPFALCLDTVLLHILLVSLLAIWCGVEMIGFGNAGMWFFGRWSFVPNGAYSLPLLALPGLIWGYRKGSVATVALYVPLFAWWFILQPIAWQLEEETTYVVGAVGGFLLVLAELHAGGSRFAVVYRLCGVALTASMLLALSFYDLTRELVRQPFDAWILLPMMMVVALMGMTIYFSYRFRRADSEDAQSVPKPIQDQLPRLGLPIGITLLMVALMFWQMLGGGPLIPTIAANIAMIALAVWLVSIGLREDRGQPFSAGVLYFLLWAVVRYIDLFGDFGGMLGASLMFFICGASLLGVAFYWRTRRNPQHVQ